MSARFRRIALALLLAGSALAAPHAARAQIVRAFTPRFTASQPGDITIVGNTVMTCNGGGTCANGQAGAGTNVNDNDFTMVYVDVDGDGTTVSSSNATLTLPTGAGVLWAGLYWGGYTGGGNRTTVRLRTPVAGYVTVNAARTDASGQAYQCFADVTAQVQAGGAGSYMVGNVRSTPNNSNVHAGWALVVVYSDVAQPSRNLVVFDGYGMVSGTTSMGFTVSGFVTPPAGVVNTRLGVVAYEGDLGFTGDAFQLNGSPLSDAANPADNFFNSTIARFGTRVVDRNPAYQNQLGFDIDMINASGKLPNGATSANVLLTTNGDTYYPGVVSFATDLYSPVFDATSFTKTVTDLNGGTVRPGDVLEYTMTMRNTGQDNALACALRDTLPANVTYVAGSLSVASGPNAGTKTDASGDDVMDYLAAARCVVARLGTGATAAAGGRLDIGVTTSVKFRVTVNAGTASGTAISNQAVLTVTGAQTNATFVSRSDGDAVTPGVQPTTVTVTSGVSVSGTVYSDANHDGARQSGELGTGTALYVKLFTPSGTTAVQVAAASPASGDYAFGAVSPGTYRLVLDGSSDPADATPTIPPGWLGLQNGSGLVTGVVVGSTSIAGGDFGLWHGSRLDGVVFRDDAGTSGIANNGVKDATETGVANVRVRLGAACAGGACDSALTDAGGAFSLWLPFAGATGTATVTLVEPLGWLATGGGAGTTGGAYARTPLAVTFPAAAGVTWSGVAFGEVPGNRWLAPGARTVAPGGVAFYSHTFTAGSAGSVRLAGGETPVPVLPGWDLELYRDSNCNGVVDLGEPRLAATDAIALAAGQQVCVIARHVAPPGAPPLARETATLTASFTYANASPALASSQSLDDVTTVSAAGGLVITKSVDRANAAPGDLLTYTITYSNPGNAPLSNIVIRDATPTWTVFQSAACGTAGSGITGCTPASPAVGASGTLSWTLAGSLAPGGSGTVTFTVRVQ